MSNPIVAYKEKSKISYDFLLALTGLSRAQLFRLLGRKSRWEDWRDSRLQTIIKFHELSDGGIDLLDYATKGQYKIKKNNLN